MSNPRSIDSHPALSRKSLSLLYPFSKSLYWASMSKRRLLIQVTHNANARQPRKRAQHEMTPTAHPLLPPKHPPPKTDILCLIVIVLIAPVVFPIHHALLQAEKRARPLSQLVPQCPEQTLGDFISLWYHDQDTRIRVESKLLVDGTGEERWMIVVVKRICYNDELAHQGLAIARAFCVSSLRF